MRYRVTVIPGGSSMDPLGSRATIYIQRGIPGLAGEVLTNAGAWVPLAEGTYPDPTVGFSFPAEAMEALIEGIERMQGQPSHAKTEAAVLREWLAVERGRVDKVLDK